MNVNHSSQHDVPSRPRVANRHLGIQVLCFVWLWSAAVVAGAADEPMPDARLEHFERHVRPILAEHCYACHNSQDTAEGDLALDYREGLLRGGVSGAAIVPNQPDESLLLRLIRHEIEGQEMPSGGPKLGEAEVAAIERWIRDGAVDPRVERPTAADLAEETSWEAKFARRKQWWSLRPIMSPEPPADAHDFSTHPVDRFLRAAQADEGLVPSQDADASTVLRRLHYVLTGLPAVREELMEFTAEYETDAEAAVAAKADELLASHHFGERWARHWMDWFRYSEGYGGQGDPPIENAYEYRDYLIRALNADVPYDQLVREHIAGDLIPNPRIDRPTRVNESLIGLASLRMVEHGFFPVDALDELVKFTDNQIDVLSKAVLGLTVSCARCHDHKFDAISQRDYYALFGILASSRPAVLPVTTGQELDAAREELTSRRAAFAAAIRAQWLADATDENVERRLDSFAKRDEQRRAGDGAKAPAPWVATDLPYAWLELRDREDLRRAWREYAVQVETSRAEAARHNAAHTARVWDFTHGLPDGWRSHAGTLEALPAGELGMGVDEDVAVLSVLPAGLYSHAFTAKEEASLASPDFRIPDGAIAARWAGAGVAWFRLSPENYPMSNQAIYRQSETTSSGESHWFSQTTSFWKDRRGYFHFMTRGVSTASSRSRESTDPSLSSKGRRRGSWFGVSEVRLLNGPSAKLREEQFAAAPLIRAARHAPTSRRELAERYAAVLRDILTRWTVSTIDDDEALFLSDCLRTGVLDGSISGLNANSRAAIEAYRRLEDSLPEARFTPCVVESDGFDFPLLPRGNHREPDDPTPRGFLSALGGEAYTLDAESGRSRLAVDLTAESNPLTPRVIANRLWHHVYGRGIVRTPDNFGATGAPPTHPALLDHLAAKMRQERYSLKSVIRHLLTARTFRLSSAPTAEATRRDPANGFWTHAEVRRFDAEIIRDHMLAVAGQLDAALHGASLSQTAPPERDRRRGVYVAVDRGGQNRLLGAFDAPMPTTTRGARDVTTTPAQSLALLNSPFVWRLAEAWSRRSWADSPTRSARDRACDLLSVAFTREPREDEVAKLIEFIDAQAEPDQELAWKRAAHLVFNLKEFIYLP